MGEAIVMTEVGRVVWGHPSRMVQQTDDDDKPLFNDDGTPVLAATFGLALPKATFGAVSAAMSAAATGVPGAGGSDFAWKFKDGDTAKDKNGKPFSEMPGRAGCYIITVSTRLKEYTTVSKHIGGGQYQTMGENEVKTGDFLRTSLKIVGHGPTGKKNAKPGLYLNPQGHEFIGYGEAISSGPNAAALFGNAPAAALPPGASATPIAPTGSSLPPGMGGPPPAPAALPPGAPGNPQPAPFTPNPPPVSGPPIAPAAVPPGTIPVASPPPTAFPSNVQPHPQFVQQVMQPQPAPAPAPAPMPAPAPAPAAPQPGGNGQQPVGFDPATGRPIYGYTPHNGTNFPIYGYNPDGTPIYA